jgi:hypothetical protein
LIEDRRDTLGLSPLEIDGVTKYVCFEHRLHQMLFGTIRSASILLLMQHIATQMAGEAELQDCGRFDPLGCHAQALPAHPSRSQDRCEADGSSPRVTAADGGRRIKLTGNRCRLDEIAAVIGRVPDRRSPNEI